MQKWCTIATHVGSEISKAHNRRDPKVVDKQPHIRKGDGAFYDIIMDKQTRAVYHSLFDEALKEYNAKQVRADRTIDDYYDHIRDSKDKELEYEMLVGIYHIDDVKLQTKIIREFADTWSQRNPNMHLTGIYLHADEDGNSPHLHIDYIPVSKQNKRGLAIKNSLNLALEEMGYKTSFKQIAVSDGRTIKKRCSALESWTRDNNEYLEKLCIENGLAVMHPDREKAEKGLIVKHMDTQEYKMAKLEEEMEQAKKISKGKEKLRDLEIAYDDLNDRIEELKIDRENVMKIIENNKETIKNQAMTLSLNRGIIGKQNISMSKNHESISRQVELFNRNKKILDRQKEEMISPTEKEILEELREAYPDLFSKARNRVLDRKEREQEEKYDDFEIDIPFKK